MHKRWLGSVVSAAWAASVCGALTSCEAYGPQTELSSSGQGSYSFRSKPADPSEQTPTSANRAEAARHTLPVGEEQMSTPGNGGGPGTMWIPKPERPAEP